MTSTESSHQLLIMKNNILFVNLLKTKTYFVSDNESFKPFKLFDIVFF